MKAKAMGEASLLPALLFILFLGLKLAHVINWSWVWIFSPLWIPIAIIGVVAATAALVIASVMIYGFIRKSD